MSFREGQIFQSFREAQIFQKWIWFKMAPACWGAGAISSQSKVTQGGCLRLTPVAWSGNVVPVAPFCLRKGSSLIAPIKSHSPHHSPQFCESFATDRISKRHFEVNHAG
jgi:hypothetical protein